MARMKITKQGGSPLKFLTDDNTRPATPPPWRHNNNQDRNLTSGSGFGLPRNVMTVTCKYVEHMCASVCESGARMAVYVCVRARSAVLSVFVCMR